MKQFAATPRTPVKGIISLRAPDGTPLDGTCSVSVVRGAFEDWQPSDGITSYFGLSSELKGRINRPDYYFDPDIPEEERDAALDILMMVQGWRYYDMEKIADRNGSRFTVRHPREVMQEIRGSVTRRLSSRMPKKFTFTVWIPKQDMLQSVNVEQGRTFIIDSLDFPENTEFLISIGTKRQLASYLPKWDGDPAAGPFLYQPAPGWGGRAETPLLHEAASDDSLKAAVITAAYEDIEPLINGRSYQRDLETYKDLTLVEYLAMTKAMFEYDGEHMYNRNWRKYASPHWEEVDITEGSSDSGEEDENERHGAVKLIVDGSVQPWWGYDMLRLEDIRSLSISTQTDPIYGGEGGVVWLSVKPGGLKRSEGRDPLPALFRPARLSDPPLFRITALRPGRLPAVRQTEYPLVVALRHHQRRPRPPVVLEQRPHGFPLYRKDRRTCRRRPPLLPSLPDFPGPVPGRHPVAAASGRSPKGYSSARMSRRRALKSMTRSGLGE